MIQGRAYSYNKETHAASHKQISSLDKNYSRKLINSQLRYQKVMPSQFPKHNHFQGLQQSEQLGMPALSPGGSSRAEQIKASLQRFTEKLMELAPRVEEQERELTRSREEMEQSYERSRKLIMVAYAQLVGQVQKEQGEQLAVLEGDRQRGMEVYQTLLTRLRTSGSQVSHIKADILYDIDDISRKIPADQYSFIMMKYDQEIQALHQLMAQIDSQYTTHPSVTQKTLQVVSPVHLHQVQKTLLTRRTQERSFTNFIKQHYSKSKVQKTQPDQPSFVEKDRSASKLWRLGSDTKVSEPGREERVAYGVSSGEAGTLQKKSHEASMSNSVIKSILKSSQSAQKIKGILDKVQASQSRNDEYFSEIETRHVNVIKEFETPLSRDMDNIMQCDEQLDHQKLFTFIRDQVPQEDMLDEGNEKSLFCSPTFKEF